VKHKTGSRIEPNVEKHQKKHGVSQVEQGFWLESSGKIYDNVIVNFGGLDTALCLKREVNWIMMTDLSTDFRLLIADDNSSFRQTVREVLERRFHFEISEVSCGEEAVDYVQECQIDIVLLDMHMHHMTGLDTIRVLKDMNAVRPCILITSDDSDDLRRDASEVNVHTVLQKPVRRQELVITVSLALHDAYDEPISDDLLA
jgi:CheY-like chemotaxis protein